MRKKFVAFDGGKKGGESGASSGSKRKSMKRAVHRARTERGIIAEKVPYGHRKVDLGVPRLGKKEVALQEATNLAPGKRTARWVFREGGSGV